MPTTLVLTADQVSDLRKRKVFTTGQISQICKVAPRTVSKWFDAGRLKGYRIPGSTDRRVPRDELLSFLKENNMPLGPLQREEEYRVLLLGTDRATDEAVAAHLPAADGYAVRGAADAYAAGVAVVAFEPHVVVIDFVIGRAAACGIRERLPAGCVAVAVLAELDEVTDEALRAGGFAAVFRRPFDARLLADRLAFVRDARAGGW